MNVEQFTDGDERVARRYDYEHSQVIAIDLGGAEDDVAVDVVGDTAIVVSGDEQVEIELDGEAAEATANNGVVTIETEVSA